MRPEWLDLIEYPFEPNYFSLASGNMHYVDEGTGAPVLLLHGNPDWSFSYRKVIKMLTNSHRCIAPDHLGFGLSDKPLQWTYAPWDHARNLERLVVSLDLNDITLVVNDWGGPIGFDFLAKHPDRVKGIVIMNTWMWPLNGYPLFWLFSRLMSGFSGKLLTGRLNLFSTLLVWLAIHDKHAFSKDIHRQYCKPYNEPWKRAGQIIFPKYLMDASCWFLEMWENRAIMQEKDCRIVWGMRDPAFGKQFLKTWKQVLAEAQIYKLENAGHFPHEERPDMVREAILGI